MRFQMPPVNRASLLLVCSLLSASAAGAVTFEYASLRTARLPSGVEITVTGTLDQITIPIKAAGGTVEAKKLSDVMSVTKIALNYGGDIKEADDKAGSISGNTWSVVTKKLPEGKSALLILRFSGQLKDDALAGVIDRILADPAYDAARQVALQFATSTDPQVHVNAAKVFAQTLAGLVQKAASDKLVMTVKDPSTALLTNAFNIRTSLEDMVPNSVPGIRAGMTYAEAAAAVQNFFAAAGIATVPAANALPATATSAQRAAATYFGNYQSLRVELRNLIVAQIEASNEESKAVEIKDFEKFAGVDYGAIYIPRMQALRHFATVNIYFGKVEDSPVNARTAPTSANETPGRDYWESLRQRVSLTFGMSLGDISSQENSDIKADNAFLYGVGFRLNKYFRITAGGAAFRDKRNDGIRHGFMIGPSVDLTAFKYIRGIFGAGE